MEMIVMIKIIRSFPQHLNNAMLDNDCNGFVDDDLEGLWYFDED